MVYYGSKFEEIASTQKKSYQLSQQLFSSLFPKFRASDCSLHCCSALLKATQLVSIEESYGLPHLPISSAAHGGLAMLTTVALRSHVASFPSPLLVRWLLARLSASSTLPVASVLQEADADLILLCSEFVGHYCMHAWVALLQLLVKTDSSSAMLLLPTWYCVELLSTEDSSAGALSTTRRM